MGGGFIKKFPPHLQLDKQSYPNQYQAPDPAPLHCDVPPPEAVGTDFLSFFQGLFGAWCSAPARSGVRGGGGAERKARHPAERAFFRSAEKGLARSILTRIHFKASSSSVLPGCRPVRGLPQSPPQGSSSCLIYVRSVNPREIGVFRSE